MKVVLLKNVENIGKKFEVKEVKAGYAKNFLIERGLAKPATEEVMKWVETQKEEEQKKAEDDLKKAQEIASQMDGIEVVIPVKRGKKGELFEKVTGQKISEKLKEAGFDIRKNQIILEKPFEETGEFSVKVKLEHNLEAEIRVIIQEEKEEKEKDEE